MNGKISYVEDNLKWDPKMYALYRKKVPKEIMSKIILFLKEKYKGSMDIAVDVGCGSGQGTIALAPLFKEVYGIDGLESQIEEAKNTQNCRNITYNWGPAEILPFQDNSVQLITAATCLHWFNIKLFMTEAKRILCDQGVLAVYGYTSIKPSLSSFVLSQKVEQLYEWFNDALRPYWKPQPDLLRNKYLEVDFPFEEVIRLPDVRCIFKGRLSDIVGYMKTLSSLAFCMEQDPAKGIEIITEFEERLYEIGKADNILSNEVTNLFADYVLILSRKESQMQHSEDL